MKLPALQFYPADWLRDSQLRMTSASTRGLWIDLLCHMWNAPKRGVIEGTADQIQRLLGCSASEFDTFLSEAAQLRFCDIERYGVTDRNAKITIANRRMVREENARNCNAIRQSRFRHAANNAKVTTPSSSSSSKTDKRADAPDFESSKAKRSACDLWFDNELLPAYPNRVQVKSARAAVRKLKLDAEQRAAIMTRLEKLKISADWTRDGGRYVPCLCKFFDDRWYERDPKLSAPTLPLASDHYPARRA